MDFCGFCNRCPSDKRLACANHYLSTRQLLCPEATKYIYADWVHRQTHVRRVGRDNDLDWLALKTDYEYKDFAILGITLNDEDWEIIKNAPLTFIQKNYFHSHYWIGITFRDIAGRSNLSLGTVSNQVKRAKYKLYPILIKAINEKPKKKPRLLRTVRDLYLAEIREKTFIARANKMRKAKTTGGDDEEKKSSWMGGMSFKSFEPYQCLLLNAPDTVKLWEQFEEKAREGLEGAYQELLKTLKAIDELEEFNRLDRNEKDNKLLHYYRGRLPKWEEIKPDLLKLIASNSELTFKLTHIRKLLPTHKDDKRYRVGVINCFTDNGSKLEFLSKALNIVNSNKDFSNSKINKYKIIKELNERTNYTNQDGDISPCKTKDYYSNV